MFPTKSKLWHVGSSAGLLHTKGLSPRYQKTQRCADMKGVAQANALFARL